MSNWIDYSQNRKIRDLEDSLNSAHYQMASDRRRMRSELSRIQGTLEQRVNRVSASLDAFIELSDIRATLAMFDGAALARHRVLQMLDGAALPRLDLADVPGYWLTPAARGLHALLAGDTGTARARFDEAARRDAGRARHFAAMATALTRAEHARAMGEGVTAELLPHLPGPSEEVTRGQRALWLLTADGSFGDEAREHLLLSTVGHWARQEVRAPAATALSASLTPAAEASSVRPVRRGPSSRREPQGIERRAAAAQRITGLRESVARITALGGEGTPLEALAPDEVSAEFLDQTLRLLVEEGSAEEAPLLARAGELRAVIEGEDGPRPRWTETVGTVGELLDDDLVRQDAPPHRRTFALVLQRPAVMEGAEELVREAAAPVEDATVLSAQGVRVRITSNGADPGELERARDRLRMQWGYEGSAPVYVWGFLAVTGLLAVLGLVSANSLAWFLCLAAAACAAASVVAVLRGRTESRETAEAAVRRLDRSIAEAAEQWREKLLASEQYAVTARREAGEIDRLLNA
ncbi:hypothetical protein A6A08_06305 [Nocardiopsis sp. TSRI0078]|uniref:hypothetical protein n=1 Tax=unclassified Nocardiopsis TaxID=2649073 RepID=UPI00093BDC73|nr:hypothetical protein [Nocardiopsis sp. TSRI0078]OKI16887.1 hypothetical protein A6A08_06305 [Nocardiopsis sp. TSRI0078]